MSLVAKTVLAESIAPYVAAQVVILIGALITFMIISRRVTSRVLRRRTKELLREFRTNIGNLEKKLTGAMTSREEIALEIDRRLAGKDRNAPSPTQTENRSGASWQRMRTEMPKLEDKIKQHTLREKELVKDVNALEKQFIQIKELAVSMPEGDNREKLLDQLGTFHESVSRSLLASERFVGECGETLNEVLSNVSPLFHLCDCCGASGDSIFVCLSCGHRYCENCKGVQIGHCLRCAPDAKPLHMEIGD